MSNIFEDCSGNVDGLCENLRRETEKNRKECQTEDQIQIATKIKLSEEQRHKIKHLIDKGLSLDQVLEKITIKVRFD